MWLCHLEEVRERRGRWQIDGRFSDPEIGNDIPFTLSYRFGWLSLGTIAGPLFDLVLSHFSQILGEPKEPPTCSGASECQDDAVHLSVNWEVQPAPESVQRFLSKLLRISEQELSP
jgi:hypothetical protein